MLGKVKAAIWLNVKDGVLIHRQASGEEEVFDYLEGTLRDIQTRSRTYGLETAKVWEFTFEDGGEEYRLTLPYRSGTAKGILNSLASAERLGIIRLRFYQKDKFAKVAVYNDGVYLKWAVPELPEAPAAVILGEIHRDDTARMELMERLAGEIRQRIKQPGLILTPPPESADNDADGDSIPF